MNRPLCLRVFALSLALACAWSFAGAGVALAAAPAPKTLKVKRPALRTLHGSYPPPAFRAPAPAPTAGAPGTRFASPTLLDEVGHLARPVDAQVSGWKQELRSSRPASARAATLHLWLGEWEMAQNEQPGPARWHFRVAQSLTPKTDPLHGLAAYDAATALFSEGAFQGAADEFYQLLAPGTRLAGYDRRACALWLRHTQACAGYHTLHARQGIPEPPRLDPQCGVAALAASLQSLSLPYDRKTLLASCRVTGEGSVLSDLVTAGPKLGVVLHPVTADDQGLRTLPKPLIAFVEHDHFVSVVRADAGGVSYLCSDCGMWPGGRVDLTWKQWHLLNPGVYATVSMPGGDWDKALASLPSAPADRSTPLRVAAAGGFPHLSPHRLVLSLGHVRLLQPKLVLSCGLKYSALHCPGYISCPMSCPSGGGGGSRPFGASAGDPVNLATGEEEYAPAPDLVVYNPHGPSVTWKRIYNSLRGENSTPYEFDDFGNGWSQPYNVGVYDPQLPSLASGTAYTKYVFLPNGSRVSFTAPSVPSAASPAVPCAVQAGAAMLVEWDYDAGSTYGHYTITMPDRSRWITTIAHQSTAWVNYNPQRGVYCYQLSQLMDRNGNGLTFTYGSPGSPAGSSGYPLLSTIKDANTAAVLLTITRVTTGSYTGGNISQVDDAYGRSVYYQYGTFGSYNYSADITQVSQIVPTGTASPPARYAYGYQSLNYSSEAAPFLSTITVPSPTGTGTSTATINYNPNTYFVSSLSDGNGNTSTYTYGTNQTTVAVGNASGTLYTSSKGFDGNMSQTSETDGAGRATSTTLSFDPLNPYRPAMVQDGNGKTTAYTWDQYGNMLTETPPSSGVRTTAATTNTYSYANFALGELTQTQMGTNLASPKQATTYAYFEPSGLTQTITVPLPGTVGSGSTAVTSLTYDGLGNPLTITKPGNNTASSITTTMGYTSDGTYSQAAAIGQPLTITDNLGKVTHLRYDAQGNAISVTDPIGVYTHQTYTIANAPLTYYPPCTGQTGGDSPRSENAYLYAEPTSLATTQWPAQTLQYGPLLTVTKYDERQNPIRQVVNAYGAEGELLSVSGSIEPVSYLYDALYRLSTLKDAAGNATSYFYNPAGYLAQVVCPGAQATPPTAPLAVGTKDTTSFTSYDGKGDMLSRVDGNNVTTTYAYNDPESRLTDVTYPSGTIGNIHSAYDSYGRRQSMTDGTGGQTYAYDDDDALTQKNVTWTGFTAKTISYGFYPNGSRQSMNADGRSFAYSYDAVGRMSSLTNDNNETTRYSYQDNGWLATKTLGNGVVTTFTRDQQGRLRDLVNKTSAGGVLSDFAVPAQGGYDGVGNRLSVTATVNGGAPASYSGTTSYAYDYGQTTNPQMNRSQLTHETSTRASGTFSYDGGTAGGPGNPTLFKGTANTFNANNQQTGTGFGYDGNGNPTTYKGSSLTFDPENRMAQILYSAANTYDGDGLRVRRDYLIIPGSRQPQRPPVYYLYDGSQPVCEYLGAWGNGRLNTTDTFGADGLVSSLDLSSYFNPPATAFYAFDDRGNVSQRTTSTGAVTSTDAYDAYGTCTSTGSADEWGFEAQAGYRAEYGTGLILCTHRFYDPSNGRWLTRDPIGYAGGINLYGYVGNDPVDGNDPLGYMMAAGAIIAGGLRIAAILDLGLGGPADLPGDVVVGTFAVGVLIVGGVVYLASSGWHAPVEVRGKNKLYPDPNATGGHCTWRKGSNGKTQHWVDWEPNPQNPSGYDEDGRYDGEGRSHGGIPTPHMHEGGGVRPADPVDIPH